MTNDSYGRCTSRSSARIRANRSPEASGSASRARVTGIHGSCLSSGRSRSAISRRSAISISPGVSYTCASVTPRPLHSRSRIAADIPSDTSSRTASPNRRRRSSDSTASSRSSASSESSKSASRVTRKRLCSRISIPGKRRLEKCAITSSSGASRQPGPSPTGTNRASPSGTLTRAKRSSPDTGSRAMNPRLSERPEMYGNGCPGPTASGVSTGYTLRSNHSPTAACSVAVQLSNVQISMPSARRAGTRTSCQSSTWRARRAMTRSRISARATAGVRPSADRTARPAAIWPSRPATRIMKNSSSVAATMEHIRTRSRSGHASSSASSRHRRSQSSHESSRFR